MKVLKSLALSLLNFLLFLSLSTFGLVLTLNYTILNPDFITAELDKLDVSSLAGELLSEQIPKEEFPEEFGTALVNTITKLEPLVKEQVSAATYSIFDYLLGESQSLDLALTLRNTILNSDFVVSIVDELDIFPLAKEFLSEQVIGEIPEEVEYLEEYLDDVIIELEPWIKDQISIAINPVVDYLLGESQSLNVVISLEPVKESLKDTLREAFLESPPPELAALSPAALELIFNEFYPEFSKQIPPTFEINESLLGTEIPAWIAEALAEAEEALEQARQYVGYFQLGYKALIGFIVLIILGIILINRQVRSITRGIGTTFLVIGAFGLIEIFLANRFAWPQIAQLGIPSPLQTWIPQLLNDFLAPLQMFSVGLLAAGVVLLIVSFVYKPRQPSV
ncbi:hypothetical protein ES705_12193 [subsurface metagenome]